MKHLQRDSKVNGGFRELVLFPSPVTQPAPLPSSWISCAQSWEKLEADTPGREGPTVVSTRPLDLRLFQKPPAWLTALHCLAWGLPPLAAPGW